MGLGQTMDVSNIGLSLDDFVDISIVRSVESCRISVFPHGYETNAKKSW